MRGEFGQTGRSLQCAGATLVLAVAACTSMNARTTADYDQGSVTTPQFNRDFAACEKQAEASAKEFGYGPYDPTHGAYNRMFDMCMRTSGYLRKPQQP